MGIIHAATIVGETVADDEVIDPEDKVVATNLVEHLLGDRNVGCLVFNNHARGEGAVVKHSVAPAGSAIQRQRHLVGQQ